MGLVGIVQVGDPVLRQIARPLEPGEIGSPRVRQLIADMRDTMRAGAGVGLAAPQIGESIQLVVIEDPPALQGGLSPEERAARERDAAPFHVLINPPLSVRSPRRAANTPLAAA